MGDAEAIRPTKKFAPLPMPNPLLDTPVAPQACDRANAQCAQNSAFADRALPVVVAPELVDANRTVVQNAKSRVKAFSAPASVSSSESAWFNKTRKQALELLDLSAQYFFDAQQALVDGDTAKYEDLSKKSGVAFASAAGLLQCMQLYSNCCVAKFPEIKKKAASLAAKFYSAGKSGDSGALDSCMSLLSRHQKFFSTEYTGRVSKSISSSIQFATQMRAYAVSQAGSAERTYGAVVDPVYWRNLELQWTQVIDDLTACSGKLKTGQDFSKLYADTMAKARVLERVHNSYSAIEKASTQLDNAEKFAASLSSNPAFDNIRTSMLSQVEARREELRGLVTKANELSASKGVSTLEAFTAEFDADAKKVFQRLQSSSWGWRAAQAFVQQYLTVDYLANKGREIGDHIYANAVDTWKSSFISFANSALGNPDSFRSAYESNKRLGSYDRLRDEIERICKGYWKAFGLCSWDKNNGMWNMLGAYNALKVDNHLRGSVNSGGEYARLAMKGMEDVQAYAVETVSTVGKGVLGIFTSGYQNDALNSLSRQAVANLQTIQLALSGASKDQQSDYMRESVQAGMDFTQVLYDGKVASIVVDGVGQFAKGVAMAFVIEVFIADTVMNMIQHGDNMSGWQLAKEGVLVAAAGVARVSAMGRAAGEAASGVEIGSGLVMAGIGMADSVSIVIEKGGFSNLGAEDWINFTSNGFFTGVAVAGVGLARAHAKRNALKENGQAGGQAPALVEQPASSAKPSAAQENVPSAQRPQEVTQRTGEAPPQEVMYSDRRQKLYDEFMAKPLDEDAAVAALVMQSQGAYTSAYVLTYAKLRVLRETDPDAVARVRTRFLEHVEQQKGAAATQRAGDMFDMWSSSEGKYSMEYKPNMEFEKQFPLLHEQSMLSADEFALQDRLLERGAKEKIYAQGVEAQKGGLSSLLNIMLEGEVRYGETGLLQAGDTASFAGHHGPFYVILDLARNRRKGSGMTGESYGSDAIVSYVVPGQKQKQMLLKSLDSALEKGIISRAERDYLGSHVITYAEALNAPKGAFRSVVEFNNAFGINEPLSISYVRSSEFNSSSSMAWARERYKGDYIAFERDLADVAVVLDSRMHSYVDPHVFAMTLLEQTGSKEAAVRAARVGGDWRDVHSRFKEFARDGDLVLQPTEYGTYSKASKDAFVDTLAQMAGDLDAWNAALAAHGLKGRSQLTLQMGFFDINDLGATNKSLGQLSGNDRKKAVIDYIKTWLGPDAYVVTLGGDEILVVSADLNPLVGGKQASVSYSQAGSGLASHFGVFKEGKFSGCVVDFTISRGMTPQEVHSAFNNALSAADSGVYYLVQANAKGAKIKSSDVAIIERKARFNYEGEEVSASWAKDSPENEFSFTLANGQKGKARMMEEGVFELEVGGKTRRTEGFVFEERGLVTISDPAARSMHPFTRTLKDPHELMTFQGRSNARDIHARAIEKQGDGTVSVYSPNASTHLKRVWRSAELIDRGETWVEARFDPSVNVDGKRIGLKGVNDNYSGGHFLGDEFACAVQDTYALQLSTGKGDNAMTRALKKYGLEDVNVEVYAEGGATTNALVTGVTEQNRALVYKALHEAAQEANSIITRDFLNPAHASYSSSMAVSVEGNPPVSDPRIASQRVNLASKVAEDRLMKGETVVADFSDPAVLRDYVNIRVREVLQNIIYGILTSPPEARTAQALALLDEVGLSSQSRFRLSSDLAKSLASTAMADHGPQIVSKYGDLVRAEGPIGFEMKHAGLSDAEISGLGVSPPSAEQ